MIWKRVRVEGGEHSGSRIEDKEKTRHTQTRQEMGRKG